MGARAPRATTSGGIISPTTGHLTAIEGPEFVTLGMTYDGSLLKSLTWSGDIAGTIAWTHDTDFRPITEKVNGAWTTSFGYDVDSLLTSAGALTLTRDVESGRVNTAASSNVSETLTYNSYGEVETKTSSYSGTTFLELAYVRDDLGRITQKTETLIGVTTVSVYDYDEVGRLLTVTEDGTLTESYSYDPNGNRTSALNSGGVFGAAFDDQDRIIGYGANIEYEFADNGELFTRTDTTTNDVTAYDYDAVGNLRGVTLPNGDVIEYAVDGTGRRVGKTVNGVFEKGWLWRGKLQPLAELDSAGAVAKRFVYAGGVNVPALMVTSTATYRLVKDHLGSVRLVVDVATGAIAQELSYDAWGRVLVDTSPGFQPFGFAGGLYDAETGLVRFGARDYDAEIGRWTAKDPIRFRGGLNLFGYVMADPVNRRDPLGLIVTQCCGAAETFGEYGEYLPPHCWLCTDDVCAGLTGTLTDTSVELHPEGVTDMVYPDAVCEPIPSANESCVTAALERDAGTHLGPYHPYNQCYSYVGGIIDECYDWGPMLSDPSTSGPCLGCGEGM